MSVRFSNMWICIAIWLVIDLLMVAFGSTLPTWVAFDGRDAFHRDVWVVWFIAFMWIFWREPSPLSRPHLSTPEK